MADIMRMRTLQMLIFKSVSNPSCIDLFLTNNPHKFQNTTAFSTGLSDYHKMIITVIKGYFKKNKKPKRLENSQLIRKIWQVNQIFELIIEQGVANYYGDNTIVK